MATITIDRFEDDIAVCEKEDMTTIDIPINKLPQGIKIGSVLAITYDGTMIIDEEEEKHRRDRIYSLYEDILNKSKNND